MADICPNCHRPRESMESWWTRDIIYDITPTCAAGMPGDRDQERDAECSCHRATIAYQAARIAKLEAVVREKDPP